jgi:hypothetical protein
VQDGIQHTRRAEGAAQSERRLRNGGRLFAGQVLAFSLRIVLCLPLRLYLRRLRVCTCACAFAVHVSSTFAARSNKKGVPKPRGPQHVKLFGPMPRTQAELAQWTSPIYVRVGGYLTTLTDENGERYTGYIVTVIMQVSHPRPSFARYNIAYRMGIVGGLRGATATSSISTGRCRDILPVVLLIVAFCAASTILDVTCFLTAQRYKRIFPRVPCSECLTTIVKSGGRPWTSSCEGYALHHTAYASTASNALEHEYHHTHSDEVIRELNIFLEIETNLGFDPQISHEIDNSPLLRVQQPLKTTTHESPITAMVRNSR